MRKCLAILLTLALALACLGAAAQTRNAVRAAASPCYVRSGPGPDHRILGTLSTGGCFTWAGSTEYDSHGIAWYSVYYSGGLGWVSAQHGDLVSLDEGDGAPDPAENGARVRAEANLNVRTGPGLDYPAVGALLSGQSADWTGFRETDSRGVAWYQILYNGIACWVSSAYSTLQ